MLYLGKNLNNKSILEKLLSVVGRASLHIFAVQMAWFTNSFSWHLLGLPKEVMCVIDCVICVTAGVVFYYVLEIWIMRTGFIRQSR